MAECHPVGFQWVMEARKRGAKVIHVDPRFTRTSAVSDLHVPLRAGSDIVFLGALINHVISEDLFFRDYVVTYTNAAMILTEDYAGPEDLDGVFSGLDAEQRLYDFASWRYQGGIVHSASGDRRPPREPGSGEPEDPELSGDEAGEQAGGQAGEQARAHPGVRAASRGEAHGSGGAAAHPDP